MTGWAVGDVVCDHYEVREVIRKGGMGIVHRVHHREWDTDFAVKTPRPELIRDAGGRAAFEREAQTWVRLGAHPHIVACAHVRRVDGLPRVFAEWVSGGSLADAVAAGRFAEPVPLVDAAVQIAWGLAYAHGRGLVHQDVKPANVLLESDGTAKVTDFGLARAVAAGESVAVSFAGRTPAYCSPEQARAAAGSPEPLTTATDVWSWALCVLEMAVGAPPTRHGQTGAEVFERYAAAGPSLPPAVLDLLRRCFQENPEARPELTEAADALVEAYAALTGTPYPRVRPPQTGLLADGLSNQALSLLELGDVAGAEEAWRIAAELEPGHPHTTYNQGLHLWRTGRITDEQVVAELGVNATGPLGRRLLDQVLAERGTAALSSSRGPAGRPATDRTGRIALTGDTGGVLTVWSPTGDAKPRRLTRKGPAVLAVAVDRSGRTGLAARADGVTEVWGLTAGRRTLELDWEVGPATCVAISGDGRTGLTAGPDGKVLVWDLSDGAHTGELTHPGGPVRALALSDDGHLALSVGPDGVRLWNVRTKAVHRERELGELDRAVVSRDARLAAIAVFHGDLILWDARSGQVRHAARNPLTLDDHLLAVTADGLLLAGGAGRPVRFWDTGTGRSLHTLDIPAPTGAAVSGDGRQLVLDDGGVLAVPAADVRAPWSYVRPRDAAQLAGAASDFEAALDRAGRLASAGDLPAAARQLWLARAIPGFAAHPRLRTRWNELGRHGRRAGLLGVWPSYEREAEWIFTRPVSLAMTADGTHVLTGGADGHLRVWERGRLLHTFAERGGMASSIVFDPAEHFAASLSNDGTVRVWDPYYDRCHAVLRGPTGRATAFALTATDIAVGDENGGIEIVNLATGATVAVIVSGDGRIDALTVSPDGTHLLAVGGSVRLLTFPAGALVAGRSTGWQDATARFHPDGTAALVDAGGFVLLVELPSLATRHLHTVGWPGALAVGADGRLAVCGSVFDEPIVFEPRSGRVRHRLAGADPVLAAAVTADSRFAATGGPARRIQIWDLGTGELVRTLAGHRTQISGIWWNTDATTLVTADLSPAIHGWQCDWDYDFEG